MRRIFFARRVFPLALFLVSCGTLSTAFFDRCIVGCDAGEYRLESVLGQGRYGTSFSGIRRADGMEVVIKKIDRAESTSVREAVWTECAALSLLDHRGIARWLGIVNGRVTTCGSRVCVRALLPRHAAFYGIVQSRCPGKSLPSSLRRACLFHG
ncbi:MAG: protein kinase domain-containing protein [Eggerthellaceae bacterium]